MLPDERRRRIVERVTEENGCAVSDLAETLDVSEATIRRDLRELESKNEVERSHGGALPVTTVGQEREYGRKEVRNLTAKRAIATRAAEEVRDDAVVFLDAGTTTMQVANRLESDGPTVVATNSPHIAMSLGDADTEVKMTGGTLRSKTGSLVGPTGETFLERTNFDVAFVGTNAVHADQGLLTPNESEARMKRLICEAAERVVLVADASKHGKRSFVQFAALSDLDLFVTDERPSDPLDDSLDEAGVAIEVVDA